MESFTSYLIAARGWTVKKTGNATASYNCHSYAWYRVEGGTGNWWIDACPSFDYEDPNETPTSTTNISKYWDDGSYLETIENQATKVYYGSCWIWDDTLYPNQWSNDCDHSAVRITSGSDAGKYESKWGRAGRYIHAYDHCPYYTGNRRYYKKNYTAPVISGLPKFCTGSSKTFSSSIWKSCYTWSVGPNLSVSGSGSSVSVIATQNGNTWVKINSGELEVAKYDIFIGPSLPPSLGGIWRSVSPAGYSFKIDQGTVDFDVTGLVWEIHNIQKGTDLYATFSTTVSQNGYYSFPSSAYDQTFYLCVKAVNACGTGNSVLMKHPFTVSSGPPEPEVQMK